MRIIPRYRTDLTEKQWQILRKIIPKQKQGPKQICRRRIINAVAILPEQAARGGFFFIVSKMENRLQRLLTVEK